MQEAPGIGSDVEKRSRGNQLAFSAAARLPSAPVVASGVLDKSHVLAALRARLERDLAVATEAQRQTQRGATHEESKPENDKDTRALESSYLARGQAQRVIELAQELTLASALELRTFGDSTPIAATALEIGRA